MARLWDVLVLAGPIAQAAWRLLLLGLIVNALVEAACDPPPDPVTPRRAIIVSAILIALALSVLLLG
jgi:hypothetical protein